MKKTAAILFIWLSTFSLHSTAADFDWAATFNAQANVAVSSFFDKVSLRFDVSNEGISAVVKVSQSYADAYIIFRLAEISEKPVAAVMDVYQAHQGKGWGYLAKMLGIKPGSQQFKALKAGSDIDMGKHSSSVNTDTTMTISITGSIGNDSSGKKK